jgi:predicted methyltransferase
MHTRRLSALGYVAICLLGTLTSGVLQAQEASVRPGINRHFVDPAFDQWVARFERPGREVYDRRHQIVAATGVRAGMVVADIGAGTGLFTRLFAGKVGDGGKVYAVDIAPAFVDNILRISQAQGQRNVEGVVNSAKSVALPPDSIDLAFICDTYHHFEYPRDMMASLHRALKPDGNVVIVDFRKIPGFSSPWVMGHVRADEPVVIDEIESAGFRLVEDRDLLRTNYFLRFVPVASRE